MTQRLPIPGSDDGTWGNILNGFLEVSHNSDGTLSATAVATALPSPIPTTNLGSGTASSSNYLRGDGTWTAAPGAPVSSVDGMTGVVTGLLQTSNDLSELTGTASTARGNITAAKSGANSDITSLTGLTTPLTVGQGGTGSASQNFVDLSSNQTIAGTKTFSSTITGNISGNAATATTATTASSVTTIPALTGDVTSSGSSNATTLTNSSNVESIISNNSTVTSKLSSTTAASTYAPLASPTFTGKVTTPALQVTTGSGTPNQVLTSDASGNATWAAAGSTAALTVFNVVTYGADSTGATSSSTAFTSAIAAAASAGGGYVWVPYGTYLIKMIAITSSNIILWMAPGVVFKWDGAQVGGGACFELGSTSAGTYTDQIGMIGGPYTFNFTGQSSGNEIRAISVNGISNFIIENAYGQSIPDQCVIDLCGGNAGPPKDGFIRNIRGFNASSSYGAIQLASGQRIELDYVYVDTGGTALNIETDSTAGIVPVAVQDITASRLIAINASRAWSMTPHSQTIQRIRLYDTYQSGGTVNSSALELGSDGGILDDIVAQNGRIDNVTLNSSVASLFGPANGNFGYATKVTFKNYVCTNIKAGSGGSATCFESTGYTLEDCVAQDIDGYGFANSLAVNTPVTLVTKLVGCKAIRTCKNSSAYSGYAAGFAWSTNVKLHIAQLVNCESYDDAGLIGTTATLNATYQNSGGAVTSLTVLALAQPVPAGATVYFQNGDTATTSAVAAIGATSISISSTTPSNYSVLLDTGGWVSGSTLTIGLGTNLVTNGTFTAVPGTGTGLWAATNCTIAQNTTYYPPSTSDSCAMTCSSSSAPSIANPTGTSGMAVTAGAIYTAQAEVLSATGVLGSARIVMSFYNSGGSLIGSATNGGTHSINPSSWTPLSATVAAPSGATFASVSIAITSGVSSSQVYYVGNVTWQGASAVPTQAYGIWASGSVQVSSLYGRYNGNTAARTIANGWGGSTGLIDETIQAAYR